MSETAWERQQKDNWLCLLRSGDHEVFAQFIDKYKETVFLCCRKLGLSEDESEDVASETFIAAYKGLRRYAGQAELSTWLWSIAYRKAVSFLRKNRRDRLLDLMPEEQSARSDHEEPDVVLQSRETEKTVWAAVDRLPKLWALAVILFYREQKSVADIAKIMRSNENTIKTYLFRAREKLKIILAPAYGDQIHADR